MALDWTKIEALKVLLSHPVGPGVSVQITAQSEDDRAAVAGIINAAREHLGPLIEECERLQGALAREIAWWEKQEREDPREWSPPGHVLERLQALARE